MNCSLSRVFSKESAAKATIHYLTSNTQPEDKVSNYLVKKTKWIAFSLLQENQTFPSAGGGDQNWAKRRWSILLLSPNELNSELILDSNSSGGSEMMMQMCHEKKLSKHTVCNFCWGGFSQSKSFGNKQQQQCCEIAWDHGSCSQPPMSCTLRVGTFNALLLLEKWGFLYVWTLLETFRLICKKTQQNIQPKLPLFIMSLEI